MLINNEYEYNPGKCVKNTMERNRELHLFISLYLFPINGTVLVFGGRCCHDVAVYGRRLQHLAGKTYCHGNRLATEQQQL